MNETILFLLATFIVPIFSVGYSFSRLLKSCQKLYFSDIVFFVVITLFHLLLGCVFYFKLNSWLESFVGGNIIINTVLFVALEMFSFQGIKSFIKKMIYSIIYLVNGYLVLLSLSNYDYSNSLMFFVLFIYPFISVCQLILYLDEKNKVHKKGRSS